MASFLVKLILTCLCIRCAISAVTFTASPASNLEVSLQVEFEETNSSSLLEQSPSEIGDFPVDSNLFVNSNLNPDDESEDLGCNLSDETISHIRSYQDVVNDIISYVVHGRFKGRVYDKLAELTDTFGPRMTGSQKLEEAVDWTINQFAEAGVTEIHTENFLAPHWVRNQESLMMYGPRVQKLTLLGLGSSVGTSESGVIGQSLVVSSFKELEKYSHKVKGKIVVFNPRWTSYGETVKYRTEGASRAAKHGAVAALIRSITSFSLNTPHTGWQHYSDENMKIPAACITVEDARMLERFQRRGEKVTLHLRMGAKNYPPTTSRNTVAQIHGREKDKEIVVVSGHLDSWDVGVGAMDDGGGTMISWSVPVILKEMDLIPRRTVRTVLFTGEEQGLWGGQAYFKRHFNGTEKFQILMESDIGTFTPYGLSFSGTKEATCIMKEVLKLLEPLNATKLVTPMFGGPDITFWRTAKIPTGALHVPGDKYFWYHHSEGDRLDVENSPALDSCSAVWTAVAYVLADMNITLPR